MYDYRGLNGTGTKDVPATGSNMAGYTVSKLADGNCWMTSNLKLELSTSQAIEVVANATGEAESVDWTPTSGKMNSYTPINGNTVCTGSDASRQCWYSWYAATAGGNFANYTDDSADALDSICPVGWRLPSSYTVTPQKSYGNLTNIYFGFIDNLNTNKVSVLEANPMIFARAGSYAGATLSDSGELGAYWSSAAPTLSDRSSLFQFTSTITYPNSSSFRYIGYNVRCLTA